MRLYHGTTSQRATAIRREGLRAGSFVTTDIEWAKRYANGAVRRDGVPDNRIGLIVEVEVDPEDLAHDPDDDGEYGWYVLCEQTPAFALRRVRVELSRRHARTPITATSPVLPEWVGFSLTGMEEVN